ncbi:MAG: hypothetical protein GWO08_03055, partial [Gammaproteobacteria bacterium]|nr:hypothetical protein [Gammaproteobacteria bacterium]NIR92667.1 hypothetical protein [Gammaproteobacteria bacterium]
MPLSGSFNYDGTSNLLVDVKATNVLNGTNLSVKATAGNRIMYNNVSAEEQTGSIPLKLGIQPKLRFHGSTIDWIASTGSEDTYTFNTNASGRSTQYLYFASELGTTGTINKLACR